MAQPSAPFLTKCWAVLAFLVESVIRLGKAIGSVATRPFRTTGLQSRSFKGYRRR